MKKKTLTSFKEKDIVVLPTHGIGCVEEIIQESFSINPDKPEELTTVEFYKIKCKLNNLEIKIPKNKAQDMGIRQPVSKEQADKIIKSFLEKSQKLASKASWQAKVMLIESMFNSGCLKIIRSLVMDLYPGIRNNVKSYFELNAFQKGMAFITAELSHVLEKSEFLIHKTIIDNMNTQLQSSKTEILENENIDLKSEEKDDFSDEIYDNLSEDVENLEEEKQSTKKRKAS